MVTPAPHSLPGSRIQCLEEDGQLVIEIPARPRRLLAAMLGICVLLVGMLIVLFYLIAPDAPVFVMVGMGTFVALLLCLAYAALARAYLKHTSILIAPDSVVIKHVLYGKETFEHYTLSRPTRARQWYPPQKSGNWAIPQGIEIEAKEGPARFGSSLYQGELDWIEWRISRFFGTADESEAPLLALVSAEVADSAGEIADYELVPQPEQTLVRIEDGLYETVFHFPNTRQIGTFTGIGSILFGGGIIAAYLYFLLPALRSDPEPAAIVMLAVFGLFALLGVASVLNGLTEILGRKRLSISREKIIYHVSLLGLPVWWTLPTAEVISIRSWSPADERQNAGQGGGSIRTACREIRYGLAVAVDDRPWVYNAVARAILAARR